MSLANAAQRMLAVDDPGAPETVNGRTVVICYAREDAALRNQVAAVLAAHGYHPWWDEKIAAGTVPVAEILAAMDAAHAVVVILSPRSVATAWVEWEALNALERRKLIPLVVSGTRRLSLHPRLYQLNAVTCGDDARLIEELDKVPA